METNLRVFHSILNMEVLKSNPYKILERVLFFFFFRFLKFKKKIKFYFIDLVCLDEHF